MPKLHSVQLDDLNPGDRVTVLSRDPEFPVLRGLFQRYDRWSDGRYVLTVRLDDAPLTVSVVTAAIERIERHRKAKPMPPQAEPVYTQCDPAEDKTLTLLTAGYFAGFVSGLAVAAIIFWL